MPKPKRGNNSFGEWSGQEWTKVLGKSIFLAGIQAAFASCLMSSTFSVINFSKTQDVLQGAADALKGYLVVATVWTIATALVLYAGYGWCGSVVGVAANLAIVLWIWWAYIRAFKEAVAKYNLAFPKIF